MLSKIFLGKPVHWLALAMAGGGLWWLGLAKLHVRDFNTFTGALAAIAIFLVVLVMVSTKPGERVTRDEIPERKG
ncbi:MAG: hypothetical protein AAF763_16720 [Pseudomonadota bacterium]